MKYHLNKGGQNLGVFEIEELRQQRESGELNGTELVWTAGMEQWQPLNSVLGTGTPKFIAPPPVPRGQGHDRKTPGWVWGIVAAAVGFFLLCVVLAIIGFYQVVHQTVSHPGRRTTTPDRSYSSSTDDTAMRAASRPISCNSNTVTAADVQKQCRVFRLREFVQEYQLRGEHNPACDALAQQFLTNWVDTDFAGPTATNAEALAQLATALASDPNCTDPVILTVSAIQSPELFECTHRLDRALKGFESSRHRAYPKFFAAVTQGNKLLQLAGTYTNRVPQLDAAALAYLKQAFADGSLEPGDQAELADIFVNDWGDDFFERNADAVCAIVDAQGEAYRWLSFTLTGENEINQAWAARGRGWADSVSKSAWNGFSAHLQIARKQLTRAWRLNPELPMAPCLMMTVSLGDSGITEMRDWFDRTTEAQFDYSHAYKEMRWGLRPRWFGDLDSMKAFGLTALNTRRFDTDVPRQFFNTVDDLEGEADLPDGESIYGRDDLWPNLAEMYEGYATNATVSRYDQDDWRSTYAVVATLAHQYDTARRQLELLHWNIHPGTLTGWYQDLSLLPQEVAARTSPQASQIIEAEAERGNNDIAGALAMYQRLAAQTGLDPRTGEFVHDRLASLNLEQSLQGHAWINFLPTDNSLVGWDASRGHFKVQPDGSLEVQSDHNGHLLVSRARIGTEFEVRGQFEIVHSTTDAFQGGLVMGMPDFETHRWYAFRIKRNLDEHDVVSFSRHWTTEQIISPQPLDPRTNSFMLRYQNGRVTASVNGQMVFQAAQPPEGYVSTNEFHLGLGAFSDSNDTTLRYRNVQIRKL